MTKLEKIKFISDNKEKILELIEKNKKELGYYGKNVNIYDLAKKAVEHPEKLDDYLIEAKATFLQKKLAWGLGFDKLKQLIERG